MFLQPECEFGFGLICTVDISGSWWCVGAGGHWVVKEGDAGGVCGFTGDG